LPLKRHRNICRIETKSEFQMKNKAYKK